MILSIKNIYKSFKIAGEKIHVIEDLSLDLAEGQIIAITGRSGCGKTSLLNILTGITRPDKGSIIFKGKKLWYYSDFLMSRVRNREIGQIFQTFRLLDEETVMTNVMMPARIRGKAGKKVRNYAMEILEKAGIAEYKNTKAELLSGGQKQRVAIARALINSPSLILADEPDANLDIETSMEIFSLLEKLRDEGKSIIIVTHKEYMLKKADLTYKMEHGKLTKVQKGRIKKQQ